MLCTVEKKFLLATLGAPCQAYFEHVSQEGRNRAMDAFGARHYLWILARNHVRGEDDQVINCKRTVTSLIDTIMNTGVLGTKCLGATTRRTQLAFVPACFGERLGTGTVAASRVVRKTSERNDCSAWDDARWSLPRQTIVG